ncbi:MAG TPA: hypothetical protein VGM44_19035 [Polyangiaceae bacterium]|jgi:hypothetical protein
MKTALARALVFLAVIALPATALASSQTRRDHTVAKKETKKKGKHRRSHKTASKTPSNAPPTKAP